MPSTSSLVNVRSRFWVLCTRATGRPVMPPKRRDPGTDTRNQQEFCRHHVKALGRSGRSPDKLPVLKDCWPSSAAFAPCASQQGRALRVRVPYSILRGHPTSSGGPRHPLPEEHLHDRGEHERPKEVPLEDPTGAEQLGDEPADDGTDEPLLAWPRPSSCPGPAGFPGGRMSEACGCLS